MFDEKSRYVKAQQLLVRDRRGRMVNAVAVPEAIPQTLRGYHLRKDGQRPDHLAAQYLNDPAGFWRIADINNAVLPDEMSEQLEIAIPDKTI